MIKELPICNYFDRQRFLQFNPQDCANWYPVGTPTGKKKVAMYPTMGRAHITQQGLTILNYAIPPRYIFKSIDFVYVVVGNIIWQVDGLFNEKIVSIPAFTQTVGELNFDYLPTVQGASPSPSNITATFCMICDGEHIFVIDEANGSTPMTNVTDPNAPPSPLYVVAFANRFAVSSTNSTQFSLSAINLGGIYSPSTCFTNPGATPAVFAQESGPIRQMAVLHNQLFIFTDYTTGIWSNTISYFNNAQFPWKKNTSFEFDYGIAAPGSLDVDFGMLVWLGQNRNGLVQFMSSNGQSPTPISTQAVNTLLQQIASKPGGSPLLNLSCSGFLYQYEDTIFYRANIGPFLNLGTLDNTNSSVSLEHEFDSKSWHRCIEKNGQRCLIEMHEFFNNVHLVTALGQTNLYQMAGNIYYNEVQSTTSPNQFIAEPFRYENITPIISEEDYSEFITDYVEIDFVWGLDTFMNFDGPFQSTVFLVAEGSTTLAPVYLVAEDGSTFLVQDGTNLPVLDDQIYNDLFKPHIELYFSDDGGISYHSADVLEFSQLGIYQWRMRWYQLGASRNRVYKLVGISPSPIVILGAVMNVRRASGGAN